MGFYRITPRQEIIGEVATFVNLLAVFLKPIPNPQGALVFLLCNLRCFTLAPMENMKFRYSRNTKALQLAKHSLLGPMRLAKCQGEVLS